MIDNSIVKVLDPGPGSTVHVIDQSTIVIIQDGSPTQVTISEPGTSVTVRDDTLVLTVEEARTIVNVTDKASGAAVTSLEEDTVVVVEDTAISVISVAEQGPPGPAASLTSRFRFTLNSSHLSNEPSPSVIRVPLPNNGTFEGALTISGYIDGRYSPSGYGWQPSTDLAAVEVYVPVNTTERNLYMSANMEFTIIW